MTSDFLVCDKMSSMKLHGFPDNPGCRDLAVLILLLNLEVLYLEPQRLCDEETRSKKFYRRLPSGQPILDI